MMQWQWLKLQRMGSEDFFSNSDWFNMDRFTVLHGFHGTDLLYMDFTGRIYCTWISRDGFTVHGFLINGPAKGFLKYYVNLRFYMTNVSISALKKLKSSQTNYCKYIMSISNSQNARQQERSIVPLEVATGLWGLFQLIIYT